MKNRLKELLEKAEKKAGEYIKENDHMDYIPTLKELLGVYADCLLSDGVIVPPAKVGQTVYVIQLGEIYECRVNEIYISAGNNNVVVLDRFINGFLIRRYGGEYFNAFGETVFLTREEAEKALAKRSENGT